MIKRIFDLFVASIGLIIFAPVMLIIIVRVILDVGNPFLFKQKRPGKNNKIFTLYKFRTMNMKTDGQGKLLPDSERLSHFGKLLRRTSLDEVPSLLNVLKGDMSLVGPRPLLLEYLPLYSREQARRHKVKPGITGWAQINGRNSISWEEKFQLDVWYVDNHSLSLDLKILLKTFVKVIRREGINSKRSATMEAFRG